MNKEDNSSCRIPERCCLRAHVKRTVPDIVEQYRDGDSLRLLWRNEMPLRPKYLDSLSHQVHGAQRMMEPYAMRQDKPGKCVMPSCRIRRNRWKYGCSINRNTRSPGSRMNP